MQKNREIMIESLTKLQEFVRSFEEISSEALNITKDLEAEFINLSTKNQELQLQVYPVLQEDITEVYKVHVINQTDEFEEIVNEILGIPRRSPQKSGRNSILTKFYSYIIRKK